MANHPPPPPGFVLDSGAGGMPPPPPGFELDAGAPARDPYAGVSAPGPVGDIAGQDPWDRLAQRMFSGAREGVVGMQRGAEKGALRTVSGLGRLVHNPLVSPLAAILPDDEAAFDQFEGQYATPKGAPERAGFAAEQIGEFFIPGMAEAGPAGRLAKVGTHAAEAGAVRAAQTGGDPAQTLAAGALGGVAGALAPAAGEASGLLGQALRLVRGNPKTSTALVAAAPELLRGNYKAAAVEAVLAAAGVKGAQKINVAFRMQKALRAGASAEEALAAALSEPVMPPPALEPPPSIAAQPAAPPTQPMRLAPGATSTGYRPQLPVEIPEGGPRLSVPAPEAPAAARVILPIKGNVKPPTIYQREGESFTMNRPEGRAAAAREKLTPRNVSLAEKQAALLEASGEGGSPLFSGTKAVATEAAPKDAGRAVAQAHDRLMAFAKTYGRANPGTKRIQVLLDADGNPSEILKNSAAAGAATKKGQKWVWVRNLWGDSRNLLD